MMMALMMILLVFLFTIFIPPLSTASDPYLCSGGNYTANSTFQSNLRLLLTSLSSKNASYAEVSLGSIPDRAYGQVLCQGDVGPSDCQACLQYAAKDVLSRCPLSKQAIVWYNDCQLRYADTSFLDIVDTSRCIILYNMNIASDPDSFIEAENKLVDRVTNQAAYNSSDLKFATGIAFNGISSSTQYTIYALAMCTRDLSTESCNRCLQDLRGDYKNRNLVRQQGAVVLGQSCKVRYESYSFFRGEPTVSLNLSLPPPLPPSSPPHLPPSAGDNIEKDLLLQTQQIPIVR